MGIQHQTIRLPILLIQLVQALAKLILRFAFDNPEPTLCSCRLPSLKVVSLFTGYCPVVILDGDSHCNVAS